jgi:hypothetical protein
LDKAETINQGASTNSVFCAGAETSGKSSSYWKTQINKTQFEVSRPGMNGDGEASEQNLWGDSQALFYKREIPRRRDCRRSQSRVYTYRIYYSQ